MCVYEERKVAEIIFSSVFEDLLAYHEVNGCIQRAVVERLTV